MSDETIDTDDHRELETSRDEVASSDAGEPLTADDVFRLLADHRRRFAVSVLRDHERPMALADLADEVAVMEFGSTITGIPPEDVKHVYMSLYHSHVPKLEDYGVVTYDQESDLVTPTGKLAELTPYLDVAAGD